MHYGTFEGYPCVWNDTAAVALIDKVWRAMPHAEILQGAREMPEPEFRASYPELPAIPSAAFQA